jgi:hypothetical protein
MFTRTRRVAGLELAWVADLDLDRAALIAEREADAVVEPTGSPAAAAEHSIAAIEHGRHVVMVTVESDTLVVPALARRAPRSPGSSTPPPTASIVRRFRTSCRGANSTRSCTQAASSRPARPTPCTRRPTTRTLKGCSAPPVDESDLAIEGIEGHAPSPHRPMQGCAFAPRCPIVVEQCSASLADGCRGSRAVGSRFIVALRFPTREAALECVQLGGISGRCRAPAQSVQRRNPPRGRVCSPLPRDPAVCNEAPRR